MMSDLPLNSRVWVYAAERKLAPAEVQITQQAATEFARSWVSHNRALRAEAMLLEDRFLVLAVDQSEAGASGCSIDASVHFVQALGRELGIDFFSRMIFHYRDSDGEVRSVDRETFEKGYDEGWITGSTMVFDPLVDTMAGLQQDFEKPLARSWHARMLS